MLLTIPLARGSKTSPLAQQIYRWIRQAILDGRLPGGAQLPSTRDLASQLAVSRMVTLRTYEDLLAEGFVTSRGGSGTYVSESAVRAQQPASAGLAEQRATIRLSRFGSAVSALSAMAAGDAPIAGRKFAVDFAEGRQTIPELFPFALWRRLLTRTAKRMAANADNSTRALCDAIAGHVRRSRAVDCDASQVIVVNGSQQALDLTARVLLDPGDAVAIEDPHYAGARDVFQAAGAKLIGVPLDDRGMQTARLPKHARLAFVTPTHQFPTGAILPLERRLELLDWARRANAAIVEDDYDGEHHYDGRPLESLQGLDRDGRVIYMGTFSRTIFPALRIGYLIAPKALVPAFSAAKRIADRRTATLEQLALAEFIECGAYARYLRSLRIRNSARRQALLAAFSKHLGSASGARLSGADSGTHAVLWPGRRVTETEWIGRATNRGVHVAGIAHCYLHPAHAEPGLFLAYTRLTPQRIAEGIRRLAHIFAGTEAGAGA